jgi:hypothetical protein
MEGSAPDDAMGMFLGEFNEDGGEGDEEEDSSSSSIEDEDSMDEEVGGSSANGEELPRMSQEEQAALAALTAPEGDMQAFLATITQKATQSMQSDNAEELLEEEDVLPFEEKEG